MLYTIENKRLAVTVSDMGAELMSIKTKADDCEYLWQGDKKYWGDRAPILFPICGRLVGGCYTYGGEEYKMDIHGFARASAFTLTEKSDDAITLTLESSEETKKIYPFDFVLSATYRLEGDRLINSYKIINSGVQTLPYSFGGHPGFNVPLGGEGNFEDCYLAFGEKCTPEIFLLSPSLFLSGNTAPFKLTCGKRLDLRHDLFDNDAIFLKDAAKSVSIKSRVSKKSVTVEYNDFDYIGFWQADHSDATYVCIEPWNGLPGIDGKVDDFESKVAMRQLPAGESYKMEFSIVIK